MSKKSEKIKLSKWLQNNISNYFPHKSELIDIIETIAEATIPIRGLLEKGITSREIGYRLKIEEPNKDSKNIYDEFQIHEDILTHSIILRAIQEGGTKYAFIASEEAKPMLGEGSFGITTDPVDGSSNVAVNRTVGTIVGLFYQGKIVCAFYILYGVFTNLIISIEGRVAEFILDNRPYSMTFYHYIFHGYLTMPNINTAGVRCLGGDSTLWSEKCKRYEQLLISNQFKDRYSGSFVGDFHAIIHYGGVYAYFLQKSKAKLRLYYEWLPLAFIAKSLGGEFLIIGNEDQINHIEEIEPLKKDNLIKIHSTTCGGLIGSKSAVDWFLTA
jgi:fructose-1,6-bisphosphatase I